MAAIKKSLKNRWKDEYYVEVYRLARQGMANVHIAARLGIQLPSFKKFLEEKPALKEALKEARDAAGNAEAFKDYIYGLLPFKLKKIWDRINEVEEDDDAFEKTKKILSGKGTQVLQHLFLYAIVQCNFNKSEACRKVGVEARKLRRWMLDPEFQELLNEIHEHKKNFFESKLVELVGRGDTTATIFVNKTINKDRGYGEKSSVDVTVNGQITHAHSLSLDKLGLSLEARKEILAKITQAEKGNLALEDNSEEDVIDAEFEEKE